MGSGIVSRVDRVKFLGIHLDESLNYNYHINYVFGKISKSLGVLNRLKFVLPKDVLQFLYQSLIKPYLLYGIEVWYSSTTSTEKSYLEFRNFQLERYAFFESILTLLRILSNCQY